MNLSAVISSNLKQLRQDKSLSLDQVAKLSGVSKSMLAQIERGDVNPTVGTLWKIANGLKVSFTALMNHPQPDIELIESNSLEPLVGDDGKFRNYPLIPFDDRKRFEIYRLEIDPEGYLDSEPHTNSSQEFVTLFSGELIITINETEYFLRPGDSLRFKADVKHSYRNPGAIAANISMVIYYPE